MTCAAYAGGRRVADVGVANIRAVLDRRDGRGRRRQTLTRPSDVSATRIELRKHSPSGQEPTNQVSEETTIATLIVAEFVTVNGAAHRPGVPTSRVVRMSRCQSLAPGGEGLRRGDCVHR
jgi:hypothetical protein